MTIEELAEKAAKAINHKGAVNVGKPMLTLVLPNPGYHPERMHLVPRKYGKSPLGRVQGYTVDGLMVVFDPVDVLAWCVARAPHIKVVEGDEGGEA